MPGSGPWATSGWSTSVPEPDPPGPGADLPAPGGARGWAPLEAAPEAAPPLRPPAPPDPPGAGATTGGHGGWAPPQTPPGWAPPQHQPSPPMAPLAKAGDARTGPLPLHPMSVGDVLDGAFKLLKANARTILLVVAAIVVPLQLVSAFVIREQVSVGFLGLLQDPTLAEPDAAANLGSTAASAMTAVLGLLTAPLIAGAVSRIVAASYLGSHLGPGEALRSTARRFGPLLAATLLVFLAQALGFLLCIVPGVLLFALYTAVTPAVMVEEIGPIQAMRRSWRLMKPRLWPVLGIAILARMIAGVLGNLLGGIPSVVAVVFGGSLAWLFIALGSILSSIVSAPIVAIVSTLLYFDGRIRHEGLDLQIMAAELERSAVR